MAKDNSKEFKTLVIRNLDSNPHLVRILNDVIKSTGHKTGQSAIEHIISRYESQNIEIERINRLYYERKREFEQKQLELQNKLDKANKALYHFQQFQLLTQEL